MTVCALLVLCGSAKAQVETDRFNTYSPYSIFGVGENSFSWGTAETQSMAGVGVSWMPAGVNNAIKPGIAGFDPSDGLYGGSFPGLVPGTRMPRIPICTKTYISITWSFRCL